MIRFAGPCLFFLLVACNGDSTADAGPDLGMDLDYTMPDFGPLDFGPPDLGPTCSPPCAPGSLCCGASGSAGTCTSVIADPNNCGACGLHCADGHGTTCVATHCVCGLTDVGCDGTSDNICCPPRTDGGLAYCANLLSDGTDCGGCGRACNPLVGGVCSGGCYCGTVDRTACAGTPTSTCCVDPGGQGSCPDTTTDRYNCGGCGIVCDIGATCRASQCSVGPETCTACDHASEVCCHGVCCTSDSCATGACGPDGGIPDGG